MHTTTKTASTSTILAIDLGKYKSVVCMFDEGNGEFRFNSFETTRSELCKLIRKEQPAVVIVEACLLAAVADVDPGEVINVGSGEGHANEDVVALVERASGRAVSVRLGEHPLGPHDGMHCAAEIQRAREVLGWTPRHSLPEGIARFVEWIRRYESGARSDGERPA